MLCPVSQRRFSEFSAKLADTTMERRIPYMGALELTYRCNQNCLHCFCNLPIGDPGAKDELTLDEIRCILDDLTSAGCLWLLLTGGEVLLREDFKDIYLHAAHRGIFLEVFTNATLITEEVAALFKDTPPLGLEISIYGASPKVHDRITRSPGSFERTCAGISLLKRYGVPFSLKTVVLTFNKDDLGDMQKLGRDFGVEFRFDSLVCPRKDGNRQPLAYRLKANDVVDLQLDQKSDRLVYAEIFDEFWKKELKDVFICTAGVNCFNIDPYGALSPCTMFLSFQHSLRQMSFQKAWQRLCETFSASCGDLLCEECRTCSMVSLCPSCPAWAQMETGKWNAKVKYLCEYSLALEKELLKTKEESHA